MAADSIVAGKRLRSSIPPEHFLSLNTRAGRNPWTIRNIIKASFSVIL
jgi:hypothetical protein